MAKKKNNSESLSKFVIKGMQEKKGKRIVSLNLKNIENSVAEYFIICHGTSRPQVDAITKAVLETVDKETGIDPWHKEGRENAEWILLDYVDVVVHIFQEETRLFFQLEKLWADATVETYESEE